MLLSCCWCSGLLLAIINQGHGRGAGVWRVGEAMTVSRGWALAKPINSPFGACPGTFADLQGFLILLWPGKQTSCNVCLPR